jgi:isochorismate hydrolase
MEGWPFVSTWHPDLKQIAQDFKTKSSPEDVLFSDGFGEPVNAGPFYGDRKVVFVTSSKDELRVQKRIQDYLEAGLIEYVEDERGLIQMLCSTRYRHVLCRSTTYETFKDKVTFVGAKPIAKNQSYVIARFSCPTYG